MTQYLTDLKKRVKRKRIDAMINRVAKFAFYNLSLITVSNFPIFGDVTPLELFPILGVALCLWLSYGK